MRYVFAALMFLVACEPIPANQQTTPQPKPAAEDPNSGTVECHDETPTGSNISHKVCTEKAQDPGADARNSATIQRQLETPRNDPGRRGN